MITQTSEGGWMVGLGQQQEDLGRKRYASRRDVDGMYQGWENSFSD